MKYLCAIWNLVIAIENPWSLLLSLSGRKANIRIRARPQTLVIKVSPNNYKILYYLSLIRNKYGLVFKNGVTEFPCCEAKLPHEDLTAGSSAVVYYACSSSLSLKEYGDHYLIQLKNGPRFIIRRDRCVDIGAIDETFVKKVYSKFHIDLKGKIVFDVGAFIGDTAIFFSNEGATAIYAFESNPTCYRLAVENLKLNCIDNVKLFNVRIGDTNKMSTIDSYGEPDESAVDLMSLSKTLDAVGKVEFLKMDCEGCEFPALLSLSNEDLLKIEEICVEYHDDPTPIAWKLMKSGFHVEVRRPWTYLNGKPVGFLHAKKDDML